MERKNNKKGDSYQYETFGGSIIKVTCIGFVVYCIHTNPRGGTVEKVLTADGGCSYSGASKVFTNEDSAKKFAAKHQHLYNEILMVRPYNLHKTLYQDPCFKNIN